MSPMDSSGANDPNPEMGQAASQRVETSSRDSSGANISNQGVVQAAPQSADTPTGDSAGANVPNPGEVQAAAQGVYPSPNATLEERLVRKHEEIISLLKEIAQRRQEGNNNPTRTNQQIVDEQLPDQNERIRHLKLYRAALNGDWKVAEHIYEEYPGDFLRGISRKGDTALHIAAAAKHIDFVKELVGKLTEAEVSKPNGKGHTALSFAAKTGMVELAKVMMRKSKDIARIPSVYGTLPIKMAASLGHKDMVEHLYPESKRFFDDKVLENESNGVELLIALIDTDLYDVALKFFQHFPELATKRSKNQETALHAFARKPPMKFNFVHQKPGIFRRCFDFGVRDVEKNLPAYELVKGLCEKVVLLKNEKIEELIRSPWTLTFRAAEQGNVEFLSILIREYPDMMWKLDKDSYSIFHIAVKYRQEEVFKLIYQMGWIKDLVPEEEDKAGNNILHLAGLLPPPDRVNVVSGPAIQMQRELLWFQEVSKHVQPKHAGKKNKEELTPKALFTKEHEHLRKEGEKWMKDTATSCMIVATLIATVVFAASITVPGGNLQDTDHEGLPIFLGKISFKIFIIADAISLVSSTASIVNFLSILTSQYAEAEFLINLPTKLLFGLATLFVSIAAMMVVFAATFFIFFSKGRLWLPIFVTAIACFPVIQFICKHCRLFTSVLRATCGSGSLFKQGKSNIFYKERESSKHEKVKPCGANCFKICSENRESQCCLNV